jgi:hypothetical protein
MSAAPREQQQQRRERPNLWLDIVGRSTVDERVPEQKLSLAGEITDEHGIRAEEVQCVPDRRCPAEQQREVRNQYDKRERNRRGSPAIGHT